MEPLKIGCAYHSNRLLSSVKQDLEEIASKGFNTVIHMYSHNDWKRCPSVMKDIFSYTKELGLDLWVDNWGLMGAPGDTSHFLSYHPEAVRMFSDGTSHAPYVCLNSRAFIEWTKEWIDVVYEAGGRKIFWDEPFAVIKEDKFSCACPTCKKLFKEKYGREMPVVPDEDCKKFQVDTIINYFKAVTDYSAAKGMENSVCVMMGGDLGISLDNIDRLVEIPNMNNIGSDPYWNRTIRQDKDMEAIYEYVYPRALKNVELSKKVGRGHNIWVKAFGLPSNRERETIYAAEAIYDAGARNIFFWGYRGCDGNEYRSANPLMQWKATCDAVDRLWQKELERTLKIARDNLGL